MSTVKTELTDIGNKNRVNFAQHQATIYFHHATRICIMGDCKINGVEVDYSIHLFLKDGSWVTESKIKKGKSFDLHDARVNRIDKKDTDYRLCEKFLNNAPQMLNEAIAKIVNFQELRQAAELQRLAYLQGTVIKQQQDMRSKLKDLNDQYERFADYLIKADQGNLPVEYVPESSWMRLWQQ